MTQSLQKVDPAVVKVALSKRIKNPRFKTFLEKALDENDFPAIRYASHLKDYPVDAEEFFLSEHYLGLGATPKKQQSIYPEVLKAAIELNNGTYTTGALVGSLGSAKSYLAIISQAYVLYQLSVLKSPQILYGLDPISEIQIIFQSIKADLAKKLNYDRFRPLIEESPYFRKHFPHNRSKVSTMDFPNRVQVLPVGASQIAAIGQAVISGNIEEANFGELTENSRKALGGVYDQGRVLYESLIARRKSRFMMNGNLAGLVLVVSSRNYAGQLTDEIEKDALTDPSIYVYDKTTYDIQPGKFSPKKFPVYIGDENSNPLLVTKKQAKGYDQKLIRWVPEDYRPDFEKNIHSALRDVTGVSTAAKSPYFSDAAAVSAAFNTDHQSIFEKPDVEFLTEPPVLLEDVAQSIDSEPLRAVHIDLATTGDSAGLCIAHVKEFTPIDTGDGLEYFPHFVIDGTLQIKPPAKGEIDFARIRRVIYAASEFMNIKWISLDSFQSVDMIQQLKRKGYIAGKRSVDTAMWPWDMLRRAFTLGQLTSAQHDFLKMEILGLEYDAKRKKVDHNEVNGSKDVADALAGACFQLYTRRELWIRSGIPNHHIPTTRG